MGYRVLAFTFDNGFMSDNAFYNIKRMTDSLNVESIICKTEYMNEIFKESLNKDDTVCTGCFKALTTISTRIAYENNIKTIITGLSRGQIFDTKLEGLYSQGIMEPEEVDRYLLLFRKAYHRTDDEISKLLNVSIDENKLDRMKFIDYFRYDDVDTEGIKEYLVRKDPYWERPKDTGFCSTNCRINDVGIFVFNKNKGYHNYAAPLSWEVRLRHLKREDGLREIETRLDMERVNEILDEIGYTPMGEEAESKILQAVATLEENEQGNQYLCAYLATGNGSIEASKLRNYLEKKLPEYMIPSYFICLDSIPVNASGKVIRRALKKPWEYIHTGIEYIEPADETQKILVKLWQKILGISQVGIYDDFFVLGGDSLKLLILNTEIEKKFGVTIPLERLFELKTIKNISDCVRNSERQATTTILPAEVKDNYNVSSAQKRMYIMEQYGNNHLSYNVTNVLKIRGIPDFVLLERSIQEVIDRHEVLRTTFEVINEQPVQRIHEKVRFELQFLEGNTARINQMICGLRMGFDLAKAPLFRGYLIKVEEMEYYLILDTHHIIVDGTSLNLLIREIVDNYHGRRSVKSSLQYKDFSEWQNSMLSSISMERHRQYWRAIFPDTVPVLNLLTDYKRPVVQNFEGDRLCFALDEAASLRLNQICLERNVTLNILLLTIFNVLLWRYTGQQDIVVGTGITGRYHADLQEMVGMFVNMLPIRNYPEPEKHFKSFLTEVRSNALNAFEHQIFQFEDIVELLDLERNTSRNPIFSVAFIMQNVQTAPIHVSGLEIEIYEWNQSSSKFDLSLYAYELDKTLKLEFEYCTKLFRRESIEQFRDHYLNMIQNLLSDINIKLKDIRLTTEEEALQIHYEFNREYEELEIMPSLGDCYHDIAETIPMRTAVTDQFRSLTYGELDQQSNQLANYLNTNSELRSSGFIGIYMEKNADFITAILGIIKSGAAYVPLDPSYPEERVRTILKDAGIGTVISLKRHIRMLNRLQWDVPCLQTYICLDTDNVYAEVESDQNKLMDQELWKYVVKNAKDDIECGGWISSYSGESFSRIEMNEYTENIFIKLKPYLNQKVRILEIGCASGLSMYRIAPYVNLYYGTDLSEDMIRYNERVIREKRIKNIRLSMVPAHKIDRLDQKEFDIIIMNSVIQSFHGHNYLRDVLKKCSSMLSENGHIFVGDIMDLEQREELIQSLKEYHHKNKSLRTKTSFQEELFISKDFWMDLKADMPEIEDISITSKIHTVENELTKYRYDIMLDVRKSFDNQKSYLKLKYQHGRNQLLFVHTDYISETEYNCNNAAYAIYTSGSTGVPKGAVVSHKNVRNLVKGLQEIIYQRYGTSLNIALVAPFVFDASVQQIFASLLLGHNLYIVPDEVRRDGYELANFYQRHRIDISDGTPTHLQLLSEYNESLNRLVIKHLIIGGEQLTVGTVRKFLSRFSVKPSITNIYGLTECCVDSTAHLIHEHELEEDGELTIGVPMFGQKIYILDRGLELLPVGIVGEIHIGGENVGNGYLNDLGTTEKRFIKSPFENGRMLYKTGDLGRWHPDGTIQFIGRTDQQVKIRGYRIELKEIEVALSDYIDQGDGVIVIDREDAQGGKYLCAYLCNCPSIDVTGLRSCLSEKLPDYMIPSYFVLLDKIPITVNGKIDRKALPAPETKLERGSEYAAPELEIEEILVELWQEVLGVDQIGIQDNFFAVGGDSIKAIQISARIKRFQFQLELEHILKHPTIAAMAGYAKDLKVSARQDEVTGMVKLAPVQHRFFNHHADQSDHYNLGVLLYRKEGFVPDFLDQIISALVKHHDVLRSVFTGDPDEIVGHIMDSKEVGEVLRICRIESIQEYQSYITAEADSLQAGFVLDEGPLIKVVDYQTMDGDFLLILLHHLIADSVSLRILMEDFTTAYIQLSNKHPISFDLKTSSYQEWTEYLHSFAHSYRMEKQVGYWKKNCSNAYDWLWGKDMLDRDRMSKNRSVSLTIPRERTIQLLKKVNQAYHTQAADILLTAFAISIQKWSGIHSFFVDMESHGRETSDSGPDVSRTVGWFTAIYPVYLCLSEELDISSRIRYVKDTLRKVPNSGIGYGVLKYLLHEESEAWCSDLRPEISFNYHGEFDHVNKAELFSVSDLSIGSMISQEMKREYILEFNSAVYQGCLMVDFIYSDNIYSKVEIELLSEIFETALHSIMNHCMEQEGYEITPGDMIYQDVSFELLDEINQLINE